MNRVLLNAAGAVAVLGLIVAPAVLAQRQQARTRNFRVVRPGVLYRSGQMSLAGLKAVVHDYGIKTVVSLREGVAASDWAEEEYCRKEEIRFVRIPPRAWGDVGRAPVEEGVRAFRAVMADPRNHPVLVHCFAGVHRTGAYCAVYRMEFEGWDSARALAEMKACGYGHVDDEWDVLGYLQQYRPTGQNQR